MKKIITLLIITTLGTSWTFGQLGPKPQKPDHRPEILTDLEKIDPRKVESEVMAAVKEGKISREEAQKKLGALREEMEKNGGFKRPQRPQK